MKNAAAEFGDTEIAAVHEETTLSSFPSFKKILPNVIKQGTPNEIVYYLAKFK
jgi:hypothetical protein